MSHALLIDLHCKAICYGRWDDKPNFTVYFIDIISGISNTRIKLD